MGAKDLQENLFAFSLKKSNVSFLILKQNV